MIHMIESKPKGGGDCFEVHAKYMMDQNHNNEWTLVHGIVSGSPGSSVDGMRFGHAWLENRDEVWDQSNGRDIHMPIGMYYALGRIKKNDTYRYSTQEVRKWITTIYHWGPWEMDY